MDSVKDNEYIRELRSGLDIYEREVLPAINKRNYGQALMELENVMDCFRSSIPVLENKNGYQFGTFKIFSKSLFAQFNVLEDVLKHVVRGSEYFKGVDNRISINNAFKKVDTKLHMVKLSVDALYEKYYSELQSTLPSA